MTQFFRDKQRLRSTHLALAEVQVKVPMQYVIDRLKKVKVNPLL